MINIKEKFTESFAFYAAYHQHPVNQLMHIITIPIIVFTILTWLAYGSFYEPDLTGQSTDMINRLLSVNFGIVLIAFYVMVYVVLDVLGGLLFLPCVLILYGGANLFRYYVPYAWAISIALHIIAWIFQFAGHGIWEKRKPALFDSLIQAFLMAPFFIFMELLFRCGYKQEFQEEISRRKYYYMADTNQPIIWK